MTTAENNPLWNYALEVYGRPGVAERCLYLQDCFDVDIPYLLFCFWLEAVELMASREEHRQWLQAQQLWRQQMILPLREIRRFWKGRGGLCGRSVTLREEIKRLELEAERVQLFWLYEQAVAPKRVRVEAEQGRQVEILLEVMALDEVQKQQCQQVLALLQKTW